MKTIWYEIQRETGSGWGSCRARLAKLEDAEREANLSQADDPKLTIPSIGTALWSGLSVWFC